MFAFFFIANLIAWKTFQAKINAFLQTINKSLVLVIHNQLVSQICMLF